MNTAISITMHIPLGWRSGKADGGAGILTLRVLELMEAAPLRYDEEGSEETLRWQALEARVDLCLQMLAQLLARDSALPAEQEVQLSGTGAHWRSEQANMVGEHGSLALYLSPQVPQALLLPARITACQQVEQGWLTSVQFERLDPELQDWLDKTIFRHHRRQISQLRRHAHDDETA